MRATLTADGQEEGLHGFEGVGQVDGGAGVVLVEAQMTGAVGVGSVALEHEPEMLPHQGVGVERAIRGRRSFRIEQQPGTAQALQGNLAARPPQAHQPVGQARNRRLMAEGRDRGGIGGTIEEAEDREDLALGAVAEPICIGRHHSRRLDVVKERRRFEQMHILPGAHVAVVSVAQEGADEGQRKGMAVDLADNLRQFLLGSFDPQPAQQLDAGHRTQPDEVVGAHPTTDPRLQIGHRLAGGDDQQAGIVGGQRADQGGDRRVFDLARLRRRRRILQGLEAVEDHQRPPPPHQLGKAQAAVTGRLRRVVLAEEAQGLVDEFVARRLAVIAAPLAVERPGVGRRRVPGLPAGVLEALHPVVDQRRLAGAADRHHRLDPNRAIDPGVFEQGELGLAADQLRQDGRR